MSATVTWVLKIAKGNDANPVTHSVLLEK